jgi:hypothetical protein
MRIVIVLIFAISLIFMISLGWYVSLPIILSVANAMDYAGNPTAINLSNAVKYGAYAWGPVLILFVLLWAAMSAQQRDVESELYG